MTSDRPCYAGYCESKVDVMNPDLCRGVQGGGGDVGPLRVDRRRRRRRPRVRQEPHAVGGLRVQDGSQAEAEKGLPEREEEKGGGSEGGEQVAVNDAEDSGYGDSGQCDNQFFA